MFSSREQACRRERPAWNACKEGPGIQVLGKLAHDRDSSHVVPSPRLDLKGISQLGLAQSFSI